MPGREMINAEKANIGQHVFFIQYGYLPHNGDE
jgi:hypothetical protein